MNDSGNVLRSSTQVMRHVQSRGVDKVSRVPRRPTRCRVRRASAINQHEPSRTSDSSNCRDWFFKNKLDLQLEVKSMEVEGSEKPTLLFIHGAGHGAWCWQRGFTSHAISLRGQARSEAPEGAKMGGTLDDHSDDISHFIEEVVQEEPILIGHSFGGLVSQAYALRDYRRRARLKGLALLAAAPPQGSNAMINRFFTRKPLQAIMLTWSFITKSYLKNTVGVKRLFFSKDLPQEQAERYLKLLQDNKSKLPAVDVGKIKEVCPLPACDEGTPPVLVVGGDSDYTVDLEGIQETADHYGVQPVIFPGLAHDLMLDTHWEKVAEKLHEWVVSLH